MIWRPIETAPIDGTDILVCVTHNLPDGTWETIQWVDWQKDDFRWPVYQDRIDIPFPPSMWTPLPDTPESSPLERLDLLAERMNELAED